MVSCVAYGCTNRNDKKKEGITFHRFPKNTKRRLTWVKAVKRKNWEPSAISVLCSEHFHQDDFDRTSLSYVRIKETAVPSIFPSYLKTTITPRKVPVTQDLSKLSMEEVKETESAVSKCSKLDAPNDDMPGCAAYGCSNRSENGFSLKVFPRDPERRALWTAMVNRKDWTPTNTSYICEKHFADNQWEVTRVDGKKKLKANAVPTIFEISKKRTSNVKKECEDHNDVNVKHKRTKNSNQEAKTSLSGKNGSPYRKRGRKTKVLKMSDDDNDNDINENVIANTKIVAQPLECFVCCCSLVNGQEVHLNSFTTTSGVTMYQRLIGISNSEAVKLQSCGKEEMGSLCNRCACLINYVDRMEAELALLKGAISGCLQIKSLNKDSEQLDTSITSHIVVLEQFNSKFLGSNSAASVMNTSEKNHLGHDEVSRNDVGATVDSVNSCSEDIVVSLKEFPSSEGEEFNKTVKNTADKEDPSFQCQICLLRTPSRAVLIFHLRKHMSTTQWCDFCDSPLKSFEDDENNTSKLDSLSSKVDSVIDDDGS